MVRINITPAAYAAIAETLPLGSIAYEPELKERGSIWSGWRIVDRLRAMRGPRESYSDVILRLVEAERGRNR